jgi:hypothetical protein
MKRRNFLELAGLGLCSSLVPPKLLAEPTSRTLPIAALPSEGDVAKAYGSGHFGKWISDPFGLPAYQYTCNQITDPKAVSPVDKAWRSSTDHTHQVGNDRLVAAISNYGYVQVRQDEGAPKFLNDYCPEHGRYGAGIGFLGDEYSVLSTYYSGTAESFDRTLGVGYLQKRVTGHQHAIDQVIFAPFGDDPVLISQVTITNHSDRVSRPRWVEYWGCHNYQFSYRSLMEAALLAEATTAPQLRRDFSDRFVHQFVALKNGKGLVETQLFRGRAPEAEEPWQRVQAALKGNPTGFYGGPVPPFAPGTTMDDLHPPSTFLVSLDAPVDAFATNGTEFFKGGMDRPLGMTGRLHNDLSASGPESALFLERDLALNPGESRTMYFLYGYLPEGFNLDNLIAKYAMDTSTLWTRSSSQWKERTLIFRTESEPWAERETAWSGYYLRSSITYDSFFREHIVSQGSGVQYIAGIQGAARDPLQHALPFIFTDPKIVREVIRYTLKEIQSNGSIPYGIVGCGVPMPCRYRPSDLELWLLWVASEYVLATRDKDFLKETVPAFTARESMPNDLTVGELLERAYARVSGDIGVGKHGLMRLFNGDWNDSIVVNRLAPAQVSEISQQGESVLNAAMAGYVLNYYARMLEFTGSPASANEVRAKAEAQRQAVSQQWTGRWFRRAWLGEGLGWSGEKQLWLEPQPWAVIGGSANSEQIGTLVAAIDELLRKPSPLGAPLLSQPDPTMHNEAGVGTNGGIFAAITGTLVWALALVNGSMAWDEWKKNSLARHAEVYPHLWYGIWSGPDAYHSVLSKNPGHTEPDFPVMNMHAHAWPLYSAAKLLGLEFHENGINFHPDLPLSHYEFASPLLGFKKSHDGYSGWYAPAVSGRWSIDILLPSIDRTRLREVTVNGVSEALHPDQRQIRFGGESEPNVPLRWKLSKEE